MTKDSVEIRIATDQDRGAILAVHMDAFGKSEGEVIAKLVDEMLDDASGEPLLSLVAETDAELVGHLLFTTVKIEPDNGEVDAKILAPLAVVQNRQGERIGGCLIQAGLGQLKDSGVELVFVLGYPDYYSRFGFEPAAAQGLHAAYPIPPQNADAWMVTELKTGATGKCKGTVRCSEALDDPKHWIE